MSLDVPAQRAANDEEWPEPAPLGVGIQIPAEPDRRQTPSADGSDASGRSGGSGGTSSGPPEPPPVDGAALLDEVRAWFARYIVVMRDGDLDVLALWAAHTHAGTRLYTTPRLQLDSPVPESGKTTVLEHLNRLCHRPVIAASVSSAAVLARLVADEPRTILLDEVDRTLDVKRNPGAAEYLAILNSGYKVGATRPVLVPTKNKGWEPAEMSTFGPVALAGNQPALPDDTRTRIIRVLLLPDGEGRAAESDWELIEADAKDLGERLGLWVRYADVKARPELPDGVTGRFREKWLPLARIAHAAGGRWPQAVRDLAAADVEEVRQSQEEGIAMEKPSVLLLRHLAECWPNDREFWRTTEIVERLAQVHPEWWGAGSGYGSALTIQRFGRLVNSSYRIRSTVEDRSDKNAARGYRLDQFRRAMAAVGRSGGSLNSPPEPPEPSEASEPSDGECCRGGPLWVVQCRRCERFRDS